MNVYLDNAATTPVLPEVAQAMLPYLTEFFGNPSSSHAFGRKTKSALEQSRRTIAKHLNCSPAEIFFTSGGTEADNLAMHAAIHDLGCKHIITSAIEHSAVIKTAEIMSKQHGLKLSLVKLDENGDVDMVDLENLLASNEKSFVTLMHGNNEIGNLLPIEEVGALCKKYGAWFHSDMVQTLAHFPVDFGQIPVDFSACSAHKFHGPKGIGFAYVKANSGLHPFIHGGSQERGHRSGTENVLGIVGMAKAFRLAHERMEADHQHMRALKAHAIERLTTALPGVAFNGASGDLDNSLYTVVNISLPEGDPNRGMLTFALDIKGFCVSGGSACSSGSSKGSHVLEAIGSGDGLRLSFSRYNTTDEVDALVDALMTV